MKTCPKKYFISKNLLQKEYLENLKSISLIAKQLKCSYTVIRDNLISYGISIRNLSEAIKYSYIYYPERKVKDKSCKHCNQSISKYNKKSIYCIKCFAKFRTIRDVYGKNNPNYKHGLTPLYKKIRNNKKYRDFVNKVKCKDNYTCQICYQKYNLHVHHKPMLSNILYFEDIKELSQALKSKLLWDINWAITLCCDCHQELHPNIPLKKKIMI